MLGNNLWLAITNVKRKKHGSILFFIIAFLIAQSIFLLGISRHFITLSDFNEIRRFFNTIIYSVLALSLLLLVVLTLLYLNSRRQELGILRLFGAQKSEIILVTSLEVVLLSIAGSLAGMGIVLLLITTGVLYLPFFFQGMEQMDRIQLIGICGRTVFIVVLIEVLVSITLLAILLRNDITRLTRGSA
jgi:ABC-type antimicrobial peptide transport system permease subunit